MTLEHSGETPLPGEISLSVLETERLVLRAPRLGDAAAIAAMADDRTVAENTALVPWPYRLKDAEAWIAAHDADMEGASFALFLSGAKPSFVGACGIAPFDGAMHLGYWLGAPFRARGYATEAARAVIDHAFGELGLDEITSSARVTNAPSRRVLEKCGFQWTGAGLVRIRSLGASVPVDKFRLDRKTWASLRAWGRLPLKRRLVKAA